jgi:hypothetical protein
MNTDRLLPRNNNGPGGLDLPTIGLYICVLVVVGGILYAVSIGIIKIVKDSRTTANPENMQRIKDEQIAALEPKFVGPFAGNKGISTVLGAIPEDQRLLINTSVLTTRLAGYLGPFNSGIFDEDTATRFALSSGSRCLVIEVDRDTNGLEPKLIYRDAYGFKQSLNTGSIEKVAKSIAGRAFSPRNDGVPSGVANDPLIVVIYIVNAPDIATQPKDYVRFLGKIAAQLQPLRGLIAAQTPQGDFRRQAQESQLFFTPSSVFNGRIIMLCNADTTPFRRLESLGLKGELNASNDLDIFIHARLYSKESPSGLGITSQPTSNSSPACVVTSSGYWTNTPPDRLADAQQQTKRSWCLVMEKTADSFALNDAESLKKMYETYGVQSIPFTIFEDPKIVSLFVGPKQKFNTTSWSVKPEGIRFIPPKPIAVLKQSPQANAGGGALLSPRF